MRGWATGPVERLYCTDCVNKTTIYRSRQPPQCQQNNSCDLSTRYWNHNHNRHSTLTDLQRCSRQSWRIDVLFFFEKQSTRADTGELWQQKCKRHEHGSTTVLLCQHTERDELRSYASFSEWLSRAILPCCCAKTEGSRTRPRPPWQVCYCKWTCSRQSSSSSGIRSARPGNLGAILSNSRSVR